MNRKIFIGAAWPYANNSLHLGHVASLIGADILARHFRRSGDDVLYVSGSDCHGTPIVVSAEKQNISPGELANRYHKEFVRTLVKGMDFSYDEYTTTTTENHTKTVQDFFLNLLEKGFIYPKTESLPYCSKCDRFLPDRYIEGECYNCHFGEARGDQCDNCGTLIDPKFLINPKCKVCGSTPTWKDSEHFFLKLTHFQKEIEQWLESRTLWRPNAVGFTRKLLKEGLRDRAITRDIDWGVPIPLEGYDNKKIYVWFDAVIGYLSASKQWADKQEPKRNISDFWQNDEAIHYYVHGKDNIPFHSIIWPAMLMGHGDLHLPDRIVSSEYLTLDGEQFSKSRDHAIWLPEFLQKYDSEFLRYYLVANGPETSDADFTWQDFAQKINSELIGNLGNFIHRTAHLISSNFPDGIEGKIEPEIKSLIEKNKSESGNLIENSKFREALKKVLGLAEEGNRFLALRQPWSTVKTDSNKAKVDLFQVGQISLAIADLISPFLPKTQLKILAIYGEKEPSEANKKNITKIKATTPQHLFEKIDLD
jgi:methionyl-tRNA synthetase